MEVKQSMREGPFNSGNNLSGVGCGKVICSNTQLACPYYQ